MITKFKIFENTSDSYPDIGDYVVINVKWEDYTHYSTRLIDFLNNNVEKIINCYEDDFDDGGDSFELRYDNSDNTIYISSKDIEYFSPNKQDCEMYLKSKKFNL